MNSGRLKGYDFGVMGAFVLALIGVSLSWYTISISFQGESMGGGASGWHFKWGIMAFVVALLALFVVQVKIALGSVGPLPPWYKEGPAVTALGILVAVFPIIAYLDFPTGSMSLDGLKNLDGLKISHGAGLYVTIVSGLLISGCGLFARPERLPVGAGPKRAGMEAPGGGWKVAPWVPPDWEGQRPAGAAPAWGAPAGQGIERSVAPAGSLGAVQVALEERPPALRCPGCGTQLQPGSRFCMTCGLPQG